MIFMEVVCIFTVNHCGFNSKNPDYDLISRPNGSGDYIFLYFITPMKITINNKLVITKPNACFLYTPDFPQHYTSVKEFQNSYLHFTATDNFAEQFNIPTNLVFYIKDYAKVSSFLEHIFIQHLTKESLYEHDINAAMTQLFILLSRSINDVNYNQTTDQELVTLFKKARIKILTNSNQHWTVESMAKLTNLSKSQFYYYYKIFFNSSPKSELLNVRLEYAKNLLTNEALNVNQVCQMSGFDNIYHFSRYFKKKFGCPPSEYYKVM